MDRQRAAGEVSDAQYEVRRARILANATKRKMPEWAVIVLTLAISLVIIVILARVLMAVVS